MAVLVTLSPERNPAPSMTISIMAEKAAQRVPYCGM